MGWKKYAWRRRERVESRDRRMDVHSDQTTAENSTSMGDRSHITLKRDAKKNRKKKKKAKGKRIRRREKI